MGATITWSDGALLGLALISLVVTLMLFPFAGWPRYLHYRPRLFVGGVVFMPLFVAISVVLRADWDLDARAWTLALLLVGFWAAAAWLALPATQGSYVPGLEFRPGLSFRPDLILPGGVMLVKGIILTGIGLMLSFQEAWQLPQWNWWGFVMAFFGIVTIIPIRGMAKMLARRSRLLGRPARWQVPVRWGLLVLGLALLLYGFLAAFMGRTPLVEFRPKADLAPLGGLVLGLAAVSLLGRELWKRTLLEGVETRNQRFGSQLWLYLSVLGFIYGFVTIFMGRFMHPHPVSNPTGLLLGTGLLILGSALVLGLRPLALRNELRATIRITVGLLSAMAEDARLALMLSRMQTIAACPLPQRCWHVAEMLTAVDQLAPSVREEVEQSRGRVMLHLESEERRSMMEALDRVG
ncbi:MAG: hypothetical protein ACE5MI_08955 [Acidimicrobiia bacterium]